MSGPYVNDGAPRQLFAASLRAALRSSRSNASRRTMSSTAESVKKSSDLPWLIGSAVVFGPAFLYLVSPASRKSAPHHDSHHDSKGHVAEESKLHDPITMKDSEGSPADVADSVHKAEAEDVPKADSAENEAQKNPQAASSEEAKKDQDPVPKDPAGAVEDSGPTEQGQVRGKATEPEPESPKEADAKAEKKVAAEEKSKEKKSDESS
ncbi:hypothetical protein D9757_003388 [Collybiopsis confluens]|uniref:Uncharacterized protein n=1 Tax=Collybiopsis confluens TaxID=2823264 RepID=A0A8H5MCR4_9AGAR|nr:hypothetical protein D9757_003388 [Collybiopsis confluens]